MLQQFLDPTGRMRGQPLDSSRATARRNARILVKMTEEMHRARYGGVVFRYWNVERSRVSVRLRGRSSGGLLTTALRLKDADPFQPIEQRAQG
jgi:hypothetical protein